MNESKDTKGINPDNFHEKPNIPIGSTGEVTESAQVKKESKDVASKTKDVLAGEIKELTPEQKKRLLKTLKARFKVNMKHHDGIEWVNVEKRLNEASPKKLWSLNEMERTGGEPDVVDYDDETGEYEFYDCSSASPKGRRNVCYDRKGQDEAKRLFFKRVENAEDMAVAMGLGGILNRDQYNKLQKLGKFDKNSFSWIKDIKKQAAGTHTRAFLSGNRVYLSFRVSSFCNDLTGFRGWLRI